MHISKLSLEAKICIPVGWIIQFTKVCFNWAVTLFNSSSSFLSKTFSKTLKKSSDCSKADYEEINQVIPNQNFFYKRNSYLNERNSFIFEGSKNKLSFNATWTCKYICPFDYTWYPFDTQNCHLHLDIFGERVQLKAKKINYVGDYILGKYSFWKLDHCGIDKYERRGLFIDFTYNRQLTGNFLTMFLPTGMLLLISQMSTSFSLHFLDVVIEVNTTLFLVLTT